MPANGVRTLRMSKKDHPMPKRENEQVDISGLRGTGYQEVGNAGLDNGQIIAQDKEQRPFASSTGKYPLTPQPKSAEEVNSGKEGKIRGRQADKPK